MNLMSCQSAVVVLALLIGAAPNDENDAVKALEKAGAKCERDASNPDSPAIAKVTAYGPRFSDENLNDVAKLKPLKELTLVGTSITDEGLKKIGSFTNLTKLMVMNTALSSHGLKPLEALANLESLSLLPINRDKKLSLIDLSKFKKLKELTLSGFPLTKSIGEQTGLTSLHLAGEQITDDDMKHIEPLVNLKGFSLTGTKVTEASLNNIIAHKKLLTLGFTDFPLTGAGAKKLCDLPEMTSLLISRTRVGDAECKELLKLPHLTMLQISGISDDGLKEIAKSDKMTFLLLEDVTITDEGLKELKKLKHLVMLSIRGGDKVSDAGLKELKEALPECDIQRHPAIPRFPNPPNTMPSQKEGEQKKLDAKRLVGELASKNAAPKIIGGRGDEEEAVFDKKYSRPEQTRIEKVVAELMDHAEEAWPELIRGCDDKQYSITIGNEAGVWNMDAGAVCREIMRNWLTDAFYRHLERYKNGREYLSLKEVVSNDDLKKWCEERKEKKLYELQIEFCKKAIAKIPELAEMDEKDKKTIIDAIKTEIKSLETSKKAVRPEKFYNGWAKVMPRP